jgi:hypothetical protein
MIRTQIQLTEQQALELRRLAKAERVSMAHLIRDSVDRLIAEKSSTRSEEVKRRALSAIGSLKSGVPDLASNHDKYLAEIYGS